MEQQLQELYNHLTMGEMPFEVFRQEVLSLIAQGVEQEQAEFQEALAYLCPTMAEA